MNKIQRNDLYESIRVYASQHPGIKEVWITSAREPFEVVAIVTPETPQAIAAGLGDIVDAFEVKHALGLGDTFPFVENGINHLKIAVNQKAVRIYPE